MHFLAEGLFLLLLVAMKPARVCTQREIEPRLNLGVVFHKDPQPLSVGAEFLDLTMVIPYHIVPPTPSQTDRHTVYNLFHQQYKVQDWYASQILNNELFNLHDDLFNQTLNTLAMLKNVLNSPISSKKARAKRQAIQYLSNVGGGFFGLATSGNINKIVSHIMKMDIALNRKDAEKLDQDKVLTSLADRQMDIMQKLETQKLSYRRLFGNLTNSLNTWADAT